MGLRSVRVIVLDRDDLDPDFTGGFHEGEGACLLTSITLFYDTFAFKAIGDVPSDVIIEALANSGAVLFRGLARDKNMFLHTANRLAPGAVRGVVPTETSLKLHGELCYTPAPPNILWLYCIQPSMVGGETLLCDGVRVIREFNPFVVDFFLEYPLVFEHTYSAEAWRSRYQSSAKAQCHRGDDGRNA